MPSLTEYLNKPEYVFRPWQAARRLRRSLTLRGGDGRTVVRLPWRLDLGVRAADDIGRAIWTMGIYDLAVSEVLWRLTVPGDVVVDGGANLGHMTGLLSRRAGTSGSVWAFEPHPGVFADLEENVRRWEGEPSLARIELRREALSDHAGTGGLVEGPAFARNRGTAQVVDAGGGVPVPLTTLDARFPSTALGVLKLDVEGHEGAALRGAERLIGSRAIRDIVYEAHGAAGGEESAWLEARGYVVFGIGKAFRGPVLERQLDRPAGRWMPPSWLATSDPERAAALLRPRGWRCLRGR